MAEPECWYCPEPFKSVKRGIVQTVRMHGPAWMEGGVCDATPVRDVQARTPDAAARSVSLLADDVFQTDLGLCADLNVPVAHFDPEHIRALMRQGRERTQQVV